MTEKQLQYRIKRTEEALSKERSKNLEKTSHIGWGSGFRKQYVGPCCRRENELEIRLKKYQEDLQQLILRKQEISCSNT